MRNIRKLGELGFGLVLVGDVALNVLDQVVGVPRGTRAACHAVDFPGAAGGVVEREDLGEAVADDAGDADDESDVLVLGVSVVIVGFSLIK